MGYVVLDVLGARLESLVTGVHALVLCWPVTRSGTGAVIVRSVILSFVSVSASANIFSPDR